MNTSAQSGKSLCVVAVSVSFQKWVMTEQKWKLVTSKDTVKFSHNIVILNLQARTQFRFLKFFILLLF